MYADFSVHCCRNLLSQFPGILSHSARFSGNNCSTVVTVTHALMQVRYSFWTSRKKELAQKPTEEEAYSRSHDWIVHVSIHFRYWSWQRQKFCGISSIMDTLVIIAPCNLRQHSMWFPILHCNRAKEFFERVLYEAWPLNLQTFHSQFDL